MYLLSPVEHIQILTNPTGKSHFAHKQDLERQEKRRTPKSSMMWETQEVLGAGEAKSWKSGGRGDFDVGCGHGEYE